MNLAVIFGQIARQIRDIVYISIVAHFEKINPQIAVGEMMAEVLKLSVEKMSQLDRNQYN